MEFGEHALAAQTDLIDAVEVVLLFEKRRLIFNIVRVWKTTVNRTNSCALRFIVESLALGALVGNDKVKLRGEELTLEPGRRCTVVILRTSKIPFRTSLIDGRVWTLWFAGAAVDTIAGDVDGHGRSVARVAVWCLW